MEFAKRMVDLDPLSWLYQLVYADALLHNGKPQESVNALRTGIRLGPGRDIQEVTLMMVYLQMYQIDSALNFLETYAVPNRIAWKRQLEAVKQGDLQFDFSQISNKTTSNIKFGGLLLFALNELNRQDLLLEYLLSVSLNKSAPVNIHSALTPQGLMYHSERFINDPRMKQVIRNYGLVEFWEKYGWPDRCKPLGDGDFICK